MTTSSEQQHHITDRAHRLYSRNTDIFWNMRSFWNFLSFIFGYIEWFPLDQRDEKKQHFLPPISIRSVQLYIACDVRQFFFWLLFSWVAREKDAERRREDGRPKELLFAVALPICMCEYSCYIYTELTHVGITNTTVNKRSFRMHGDFECPSKKTQSLAYVWNDNSTRFAYRQVARYTFLHLFCRRLHLFSHYSPLSLSLSHTHDRFVRQFLLFPSGSCEHSSNYIMQTK